MEVKDKIGEAEGTTGTDTLSFSVIINTYNRGSILRNALESLAQLRHPCFEVVVVNGPSTDNSAQVISDHCDRIKSLNCPEANLSMSRNIGIAAARGDICCFMDDDAVPEPDWLDELESAYTDPTVGGVGGFTRDHTGIAFQSRALLCDPFGNSRDFETIAEAEQAITEDPSLFFSQTGTNSSFRRKALMEIGGFDEHFVYFLDETDVNFRMQQAGWKVIYAPRAEIHHKYAPSHLRTEERVPKSLYLPSRSKSYFILRNGMKGDDLATPLSNIARYELEISEHNRWYLEKAMIDREGYQALQDSLTEGVLAGISAAFENVDREILDDEKLAKFDCGPLKRYPTPKRSSERLKIAFLSQSYPPGIIGGIGVWTHTMATTIAKMGHEVSVVTRQTRGEFDTVDFEDGVWVHRVVPKYQPEREAPSLPDLGQLTKDYLYTVLDEAIRIHERRGLDIVSAPIWDLEGLAVLRDGQLPVVTSLHTTYKLCLPSKPDWLEIPGYKTQHIDKMIAAEALLLDECPAILSNSNGVSHDIIAAYDCGIEDKVTVIPHGLDDLKADFDQLAPSKDFPDKSKTMTRILFVGRFEDRKGIIELLAAIEQIAPLNSNIEFTLVGDHDVVVQGDTHWRRFQKRNAGKAFIDRVKAVGPVSGDDLLRHYNACDIFVAPSRYESFGLIFAEAMAFSKPCIGTRIGGIEEVIADRQTGLLVDVNAPDTLVEALTYMTDNPSVAQAMGIAGRKRFEQKFSANQMAADASRFYKETLSVFQQKGREERDDQDLEHVH